MNIKQVAHDIVTGNFDKDLFKKDYTQGASLADIDNINALSKEVSLLIKNEVIKSADNDKNTILNDKLTNANPFLLSLSDTDFFNTLITIKDELSTIPYFTAKDLKANDLNNATKELLAINVSQSNKPDLKLPEFTYSKREILLSVVTDFYKIDFKTKPKM